MRSYVEHESCLLCDSRHLKALKGYQKDYLVQCASCKFVFCKRIPTHEELVNHYDLYRRGSRISEITIKRYEQLLDTFERYRKTNNLLDLGCGDGYFLEVAQRRNWMVYGTEFTEEAVKHCMTKGIQMTTGPLNPQNYEKEFFDIITSFEVIEHIHTPKKELEAMDTILRSEGAVYVTTPNFNSLSRDLIGPRWNIIEYPEHLSYYTPSTLKKLFSQKNYKLFGLTVTGISLDRLKNNFSDSSSQSRNTDEDLRRNIERRVSLRILKNAVNVTLNFFGKGDSMKALFQKP